MDYKIIFSSITQPARFIHVLLYKLKILKKPKKIYIATFFGRTLEGMLPEIVSTVLFLTGRYEQDVESIITRFVKKGDIVVDIGAHIGYFTLLASILVGSRGKVYAFEPARTTFLLLKKNCRLYSNIVPINKAVFSKNTKLFLQDFGLAYSAFNSFFLPRINKNLPSVKIKVNTITLDSYFSKIKKPDFIKIDAENAEYEIIQGMKRILTEKKPIICMEFGGDYSSNPTNGVNVLRFLKERGYSFFFYEKGRLKKYVFAQNGAYINLLCLPKNSSS